jgi:serine/threonine-protein kinase RsbW
VQFILSGDAGERRRFVEAFEEFCRANRVPDATRQAADLALEEHLTNVLNHGFEPDAARWMAVRLKVADDGLLAEVADTGKAFNPLDAPPVDITIPLAEKPLGGLGVHILRQVMDEISYAHEDGKNVLRMKKRFVPG